MTSGQRWTQCEGNLILRLDQDKYLKSCRVCFEFGLILREEAHFWGCKEVPHHFFVDKLIVIWHEI